MSSIGSRDEFIAAMIAELEKQKLSQGNGEQFYTGGYMTAGDVFRKLCYDYPIIDDQALQIFLVGLKTIRVSNKSHELRKTFQLNSKFLDNISYLIYEHEHDSENAAIGKGDAKGSNKQQHGESDDDDDTTEKQPISLLTSNGKSVTGPASSAGPTNSKRSTILGQLSTEIFLRFPLYLSTLPKPELANLLPDDLIHIHDSRQPKTPIEMDWRDLLTKYREFVIKGHSSTICHGNDAKTLSSNNFLDDVISLIGSLRTIVESDGDDSSKDPTLLKHSAHMNVIEYLQYQRNLLRNRHESGLGNNEESEENDVLDAADQLLAITKEIWTHLVYQVVDISCRYLELIPIYLPKLLNTLLDHSLIPNDTRRAVKSSNNDPSVFFNVKKSRAVEMPSPSEYMALMVLSNVSNHITKEEEVKKLRCTATRQLLKSSREALRKYLTGGDVLKKLHDLCEIIEKFNNQGIENNVNTIDVESSSFLLDVVELIIQSHGDINVIQKLMSSRILASLLFIQRKILHNYRVSNVAVTNQSAQIWVISSRLTRALFMIMLESSEAAQYIAEFPGVIEVVSVILTSDDKAKHGVFWSPILATPIAFALALALNSSSNQDSLFLNQSLSQLVNDIQSLDWSCLVDIKQDHIEDDSCGDTVNRTGSLTTTDPDKDARNQQKQRQLRVIESLLYVVTLLQNESIYSVINKIEFDARKASLKTESVLALKRSMSTVYRSINAGRIALGERSDLADGAVVSYYDNSAKQLKSLLSLLEGGVSSKTD